MAQSAPSGERQLNNATPHKAPPSSVEAEEALLGGMLADKEVMQEIADVVTHDDFYKEAHRRIFEVASNLYAREEPVDLVTVTTAVKTRGLAEKIGGIGYLGRLVDNMPIGTNMVHYARIVKDKAILRRLIATCNEVVDAAHQAESADACVDEAEQKVLKVAESTHQKDIPAVGETAEQNLRLIEYLSTHERKLTGVDTGFFGLNTLTNGLQKSDLIVVAARPAMGKTALTLNIGGMRRRPRSFP